MISINLYVPRGKRVIDVAISFLLVSLLFPLLAVLAVSVRLSLGSPIFFRQQRPGRHGKRFELIKFRSMRNLGDQRNLDDTDAGRLTSFGRFLRSTSLDELPELVNVLKGDMSLVGPRPLLEEYLSLYTPEQLRRHEVRPGITGWAQVNGRNAVNWPERFALDLWYVDNVSLALDLKILGKTASTVFRRHGVSEDGGATMSPFMG